MKVKEGELIHGPIVWRGTQFQEVQARLWEARRKQLTIERGKQAGEFEGRKVDQYMHWLFLV